MSNNMPGAAARIPSLKTDERRFALAETPKDFIVNAPTLATDLLAADPGQAPADTPVTIHSHAGSARAVWFLTGWLAVSATIIAIAGVVIAKYF